MSLRRIDVVAGGGARNYQVVVGAGALDTVPDVAAGSAPAVRRWAVISDSTVAPLHAQGLAERLSQAGLGGDLHTFPAGEDHKGRREWAALSDALLEAGHGRDSGVIAVGGGVTGDLAGFVAATFMRGIPVLQVPTSLVAMIDASVGGKTAVDTAFGKNLIGAFHPPVAVIADPLTIATLPRAERAQGLAEALKHGAILDADYGEKVVAMADRLLAGEAEATHWAVERSVELKASVVSQDEREAGMREILNFGHTVGHALELESGYQLPHGSAVAMGMIAEARLGEAWGITEPGVGDWMATALERLELPDGLGSFDPARIAELMSRDKKARQDPRTVLLSRIGEVARSETGWSHSRTVDQIAESLAPLAG